MNNDENMMVVYDLIKSAYEKLSGWELEFLEDISIRLEAGKGLTEKQQAKLDEIWERSMR